MYLVDACDVFVSKLSRSKEKHKDDLRVMAQRLDEIAARKRLLTDGKAFLADPVERARIEANWSFVFRKPLF